MSAGNIPGALSSQFGPGAAVLGSVACGLGNLAVTYSLPPGKPGAAAAKAAGVRRSTRSPSPKKAAAAPELPWHAVLLSVLRDPAVGGLLAVRGVIIGLGRAVALHCRSVTLCRICEEIRSLCF